MHTDDMIDSHLYRAVRLWLDRNPAEAAKLRDDYSTTSNDFIWRCERIFVRALQYDHDDPVSPGQGQLL
jgi:hypothetical protein